MSEAQTPLIPALFPELGVQKQTVTTGMRMVGPKEMAEIVSLSERQILEMARKGLIPAYRPIRRWLFDPSEVINHFKTVGNRSALLAKAIL